MTPKKLSKLFRVGGLMIVAAFFGIFVSVEKSDSSRRHSILLDFNTETASAEVPPGTADSGTSDSTGPGTADSGSGDSGSGSGDSGSGDCGDGGE